MSIRGAGIRGIFPTSCLVELESQLGGLTRYQASVEAFVYDSLISSKPILSLWPFHPGPMKTPQNIRWVTNTLADTSKDWVDKPVHRRWPGLMQVTN